MTEDNYLQQGADYLKYSLNSYGPEKHYYAVMGNMCMIAANLLKKLNSIEKKLNKEDSE